MAEIAISGTIFALKTATIRLGDQAVEAGSRLFKLKQDMLWIENEMEYIRAYLKDFDNGIADETSNTVEAALVKNVRLLAYDVEDVLESYMVKKAYQERNGCLGWVKNAKQVSVNSKIALEIEEIKKRVEDINRVRQTYGIAPPKKENIRLGMDERRSFPHTEESNIVGMDDKVKELNVKLLSDDSSHLVVSIIGMAGLGKTTLAKKVYNSVKKEINCSAWICVSQQPNIPELLRNVSRQVGLAEDKWKQDTEANLFEFLQGKRYVIVIDDIWNNRAWDGLKKGIPTDTKNKSRIILTSRSEEVGKHVGREGSLFELHPLNDEKSEELFYKIINGNSKNENCSHSLLDIGKKILCKCGGIPLAIVLTSGMLRLRERSDFAWKGVLESMGGEEDKCSHIFELSYRDLPSKLRPCFLYLGLFPEDYNIKASRLINMWAAERFIEGSEVREVEEVGEDYLNQLVGRNLVQVSERKTNGRIKSCQIHDVLHSLCVRVAKDIKFFSKKSDFDTSGRIIKSVRRIGNDNVSVRDYIPIGKETPKLRAVFLRSSDEFSSSYDDSSSYDLNFIWDLEYLRVLCLKGELYFTSLSKKIGNLIHLTYIELKAKWGTKIPSAFGNLKSLMTLDARACDGLSIPSCILEMKCLRHLLLGYFCQIRYSTHKTICNKNKFKVNAINLRTLSWFYVPYKMVGPNKYQFPNLRKLVLHFLSLNVANIKMLLEETTKIEDLRLIRAAPTTTQMFDIKDLSLHLYENLSRLRVKTQIFSLTDNVFPLNIEKLILEHCELQQDPMEVLRKLPVLKFLVFGFASYIGEKMTVSPGEDEGSDYKYFPLLEVLKINGIISIMELVIEEPAMPQLKILKIKSPFFRDKSGLSISEIKVNAPERILDKITWRETRTSIRAYPRVVEVGRKNLIQQGMSYLAQHMHTNG